MVFWGWKFRDRFQLGTEFLDLGGLIEAFRVRLRPGLGPILGDEGSFRRTIGGARYECKIYNIVVNMFRPRIF